VTANSSAGEALAKQTPAKSGKTDLLTELKSLALLLLAVLGFHSFIAKPFYIPSESMLPGLLVGDQLVVTKFPYGWSYVSPTIPNPVAILGSLFGSPQDSWFVQLPFIKGRVLGGLPERGDVVVLTPPGRNVDYIKRLVGLPGDKIAVRNATLIINGVPVKRVPQAARLIPVDDATRCSPQEYPNALVTGADGKSYCRLPIMRETLPNGRSYDTVAFDDSPEADNYPEVTIPAGYFFVMGDNRDRSADSRVSASLGGLDGPIPLEQLGGRAEFITYSLDGSQHWYNPISWFTALRGGRAGTSLHPAREPK
jgi:signal peptidase I